MDIFKYISLSSVIARKLNFQKLLLKNHTFLSCVSLDQNDQKMIKNDQKSFRVVSLLSQTNKQIMDLDIYKKR